MPWSLVGFYGILPAFLLVLFRVGGLVLAAPLFSGTIIPMKIKVFLAIAIAMAVFPMMVPHLPETVTMATALVGLAGEVAIGVFLGLGVGLIFLGVELAAYIVGHQSGMELGAVYNPMMETSSTAVSQLYYFLAMLIFLSVGGAGAVIRALLDSFQTIPPLAFTAHQAVTEVLLDIVMLSFTVAIRIGGPIALALLMTFLILGFLSRTIPQLNILTVGFPIKLSVALVVMALAITSLESVLVDALTEGFAMMRTALGVPAVS